MRLRKGAGVTFSDNQLIDFVSNIAGKPLQRVWALSRMHDLYEEDGIGRLFHHIFLPGGMDEDKNEDDKRSWVLVLIIKDLDPGETVYKFSDLPLNESDPATAKGL